MIDVLKDKRIGVIMGGLSAEKEVSMTSGGAVENALRDAGYNVHAIVFDGPSVIDAIRAAAPDVVFLALHGRYGEDGTIQGLLDIMGVPYTGTGVMGSALAMDKSVTKMLLRHEGIPTAEFVTLAPTDADDAGALVEAIGYPLVVKPATLGSTIGMSFVYNKEDLPAAIALAFGHDREVLVERFIEGRELTVGILNGAPLPVVEIVAPGGVYDYEAKYKSHDTKYICPAEIDMEVAARLQSMAFDVFRVLKGYSMSRVDFRLDAEGNAYVLEMNTIPGLTGTSLLPKAAKAAGVEFVEL
ncbi:MAG: D-alanine--D-alanine ligase, partial [Nitrospirae bacterium]|nr:D-alanine--D-alanine ligase [Nitrospirota bacterium]